MLPVARIADPPIGHLTANLIVYTTTLNGHTGVSHRFALGTDGITSLVGLLVFIELHTECRTLVVFNAERRGASVGTDGETSVQQSLRQGERCGTFSILIGDGLLLAD